MVSAFIGVGYCYVKLYDVNGDDLTPIDEDHFSNIFEYPDLMEIFTSEEITKSKKKTYVDSYKHCQILSDMFQDMENSSWKYKDSYILMWDG